MHEVEAICHMQVLSLFYILYFEFVKFVIPIKDKD